VAIAMAAKAVTEGPAVLCAPICTFTAAERIRPAVVANGLAVSVAIAEKDSDAKRAPLEALLGPATVVVALDVNAFWADPEHAEIHLHWRLATPSRTRKELDKLCRTRTRAARLVGAEPLPITHAFRLPGTFTPLLEPERDDRTRGESDGAE
jgi:hypothetical protein